MPDSKASLPVPRIMRNKMGKQLGMDPSSMPTRMYDKVQPVYICNATGQDIGGVFGVHPHGWWQGGHVSYNPATRTTLVQDLASQSGSGAASSGDLSLYTVTTGKTLYIKSLYAYILVSNASVNIRDGGVAGTVKMSYNQGEAATLNPKPVQFTFDVPLKFSTDVFFESDGAAETVHWMFQGWEQ